MITPCRLNQSECKMYCMLAYCKSAELEEHRGQAVGGESIIFENFLILGEKKVDFSEQKIKP